MATIETGAARRQYRSLTTREPLISQWHAADLFRLRRKYTSKDGATPIQRSKRIHCCRQRRCTGLPCRPHQAAFACAGLECRSISRTLVVLLHWISIDLKTSAVNPTEVFKLPLQRPPRPTRGSPRQRPSRDALVSSVQTPTTSPGTRNLWRQSISAGRLLPGSRASRAPDVGCSTRASL